MRDLIENLVHWVTPVFGDWGLVIIFLATFLETSAFLGLLVPGETLVILGGILANPAFRKAFSGAENVKISIIQVILVATVGVIAGDQAGYALGRFGGERLARRWKRLLKPERLAKVEQYYRKHGGKTVFLGRFTPFLRSLGALVAGISKMSYLRFTLWDMLGAILWGIAVPLVGYIFGRYGIASIRAIDNALQTPGYVLLGLAVAGGAYYLWRRRKAHKAQEKDEASTPG